MNVFGSVRRRRSVRLLNERAELCTKTKSRRKQFLTCVCTPGHNDRNGLERQLRNLRNLRLDLPFRLVDDRLPTDDAVELAGQRRIYFLQPLLSFLRTLFIAARVLRRS